LLQRQAFLASSVNNPLTGILGNAELLLLEVRRGKLDLPPQTLERIEIITELAVRMRETVRHLSDGRAGQSVVSGRSE